MTGAALERVDPELRGGAVQMRELTAQFTPMSDERLALRRGLITSLRQPPLSHIAFDERRIAGLARQPDVSVLVVHAKPDAFGPGILHLHGGGFNAGSARSSLPHVQELAAALDVTIVSVDYRLAPETRHTGSRADIYAALLWLHTHGKEIGVDPARIALLGESAGGGHAALLAVAARDRGDVPVMFQALIYPMLDDRTGASREVPPHLGAFGWNADNNRFGWRCFLGQEPGTDAVPTSAVPARLADLAGLPPAFIGVGALDLFAEESLAFAGRLIGAGVPTEAVLVPGAFHGFDMLCRNAAASKRFTAAKLGALRRALGLPEPL
jgi:acetyl esterase/lipase